MLWKWINEYTPSREAWFYTALCAIAPYIAYRINRKLRELTDPPWKRESDTEK